MVKVQIDGKYLKDLATIAVKNGTEREWMGIAVEWIEAAEAEVVRLKKIIAEKEG